MAKSPRKAGRPPKPKPGELKPPFEPPYSKEVVLFAISKSNGFYIGVQEVLQCSAPTAITYVNKWPETKEAFEIAKIPMNRLGIERMIQAVDDGEQWAIDRILRRMPHEGLSPDKPEKDPEQGDKTSPPTTIIFELKDEKK